jgi:putative SOS response-associated peptidase YedK
MCGRFVQKSPAAEMEFSFRTKNPLPNVQPRYNAAPGQEIAVVRKHPETGDRSLDLLVWGLVPHWAKDRKIGWKTINARAETIARNASFKEAFLKRRCLVPADAFYEWTGEKGFRQPHAIAMKDRHIFAFAGLWEGWKDPATEQWLRTFTIVTTNANPLLASLHARMPVIVAPEDYERWLTRGEPVEDILRPYPAEEMEHWTVSPRVNGSAIDEPSLLDATA